MGFQRCAPVVSRPSMPAGGTIRKGSWNHSTEGRDMLYLFFMSITYYIGAHLLALFSRLSKACKYAEHLESARALGQCTRVVLQQGLHEDCLGVKTLKVKLPKLFWVWTCISLNLFHGVIAILDQ